MDEESTRVDVKLPIRVGKGEEDRLNKVTEYNELARVCR